MDASTGKDKVLQICLDEGPQLIPGATARSELCSQIKLQVTPLSCVGILQVYTFVIETVVLDISIVVDFCFLPKVKPDFHL